MAKELELIVTDHCAMARECAHRLVEIVRENTLEDIQEDIMNAYTRGTLGDMHTSFIYIRELDPAAIDRFPVIPWDNLEVIRDMALGLGDACIMPNRTLIIWDYLQNHFSPVAETIEQMMKYYSQHHPSKYLIAYHRQRRKQAAQPSNARLSFVDFLRQCNQGKHKVK